jgi:hypothetical protein
MLKLFGHHINNNKKSYWNMVDDTVTYTFKLWYSLEKHRSQFAFEPGHQVTLTWSLGSTFIPESRPPFYSLYIYFFTFWLHTCLGWAIDWIKTVIGQGNYSFVLFPLISWFAHDMLSR